MAVPRANPGLRRWSRGFTLIELMIVVVVMGILASMAVAGYRQYIRRANRVDATAALLRISAAQEQFYLQNGSYAGNDELAAAPPGGLGLAGTEQGYYALAIEPPAAGLGTGYRATATAIDGGSQADDTDCRSFAIDQTGQRSATTADGGTGTEITRRCWR